MGNYSAFLLTYILGGLTLIPLVIGLLVLYAFLTFPHYPPEVYRTPTTDSITDHSDDGTNIRSGTAAVAKQSQHAYETDVAEGYFAVCREYVPRGINGKPPERITPAGEIIAEESPSVYQTMYRSIFDRKQTPTMEATKTGGKTPRKARNVFYVVLRHSHLMLYDDSEQVEVRHVISLAHHDVSVHGEENPIPEGELWIKRNAICLTRKDDVEDVTMTSKPFYLFSENCSDKEDFYFALLQNQERASDDTSRPPHPRRFDIKDIISLVQRLHASEEQLQTRWINALIGRVFLAVYKTREMEEYIRSKITKKITRVKKPAFLSSVIIQSMDFGEAAPYITNPRLKDLTVHGDCCVEADVRYDGNFKLEIAATARIELGTRFKAREVNLVLAIVVKKLEGHMLLRLKPPPSNRVWISFESMPHIEMSIEPVVSSRQIKYSFILRAIESRIREVFAETLVQPNSDDIPFFNTFHHRFRGGIWADDTQKNHYVKQRTSVASHEVKDYIKTDLKHESSPLQNAQRNTDEKLIGMPILSDSPSPQPHSRQKPVSTYSPQETTDLGALSAIVRKTEAPKAIRSRSFASAANPIVSMENANVDAIKDEDRTQRKKDATKSMIELSSRSPPSSPVDAPSGSINAHQASLQESSHVISSSSTSSSSIELSSSHTTKMRRDESVLPPSSAGVIPDRQNKKEHQTMMRATNRVLDPLEKRPIFPTIGVAATAAKKWGWSALNRNPVSMKNGDLGRSKDRVGTPEHPIGRGHPLPPPGQPLPRPDNRKSNSINVLKPNSMVSPMVLHYRLDETKARKPQLPPRPAQEPLDNSDSLNGGGDESDISVAEALSKSESTSSLDDGFGEFFDNVEPDEDEESNMDEEHIVGSQIVCTPESTGC